MRLCIRSITALSRIYRSPRRATLETSATCLSENSDATSMPFPNVTYLHQTWENLPFVPANTLLFPKTITSETKRWIRRRYAIIRLAIIRETRSFHRSPRIHVRRGKITGNRCDVDAWIALLNFAQRKRFSNGDGTRSKLAINQPVQWHRHDALLHRVILSPIFSLSLVRS